MEFVYKRAGLEDIELLVKTRIKVLRAANRLSDDIEMSLVEQQSREYYEESLQAETHIAYLVFDGEKIVGAGGVSFFRVMPTYHNPTGWKAYIMNMYTNPDYRRKGIAYHTLEILIEEVKNKGVTHISLEATDMGRPLYERYGFVSMNDEMELPENCM
ncbi:MAG: GNAT family N-acetyltransferase [Lachnospiraceae bacterium]|nr:GNAT family N-acetyltransferase [Lachnospiraceae bacterium]